MSQLKVYADSQPHKPIFVTDELVSIIEALSKVGVDFERWDTTSSLADDASDDEILSHYADELQRLMGRGGYKSYDVVSLNPDHPQKAAFRKKFLAEHTHSEDEVRFFVRGHGLFVMHIGSQVFALLCEKGDLIAVPAHTKHWFDMGANPVFTAIRLFNNPQGWEAKFTGDDIASQFPLLEN